MNVVALVALTAGAVTAAAIAAWWHIRALRSTIRRLRADAAADRYRAEIYRHTLIDITHMGYPHQTLRDAKDRAGQALDTLVEAAR